MRVPSRLNSLLVRPLLTVLNNKKYVTHVSILVKRLSLLCVHVLQYFVYTHKILQNINTSKLNRFYKNTDMCYFMGSCFFVCCSSSIILHLWLTVTGPVNSLLVIFSPTVHFKNECLNYTNIHFICVNILV